MFSISKIWNTAGDLDYIEVVVALCEAFDRLYTALLAEDSYRYIIILNLLIIH
jgi:hypothetical protein